MDLDRPSDDRVRDLVRARWVSKHTALHGIRTALCAGARHASGNHKHPQAYRGACDWRSHAWLRGFLCARRATTKPTTHPANPAALCDAIAELAHDREGKVRNSSSCVFVGFVPSFV